MLATNIKSLTRIIALQSFVFMGIMTNVKKEKLSKVSGCKKTPLKENEMVEEIIILL